MRLQGYARSGCFQLKYIAERSVQHFKKPSAAEVAFPDLQWEEDNIATRTMALHERPIQARVDIQLALIAEHYPRVAQGIDNFWGQRDCVPYIESLILSGYKDGEKRMGFKPEVVTALMSLVELHKQAFGA